MNTPETPQTTPEDMSLCRAWTARSLEESATLPISFDLAGQSQHGLPAAWHPTKSVHRVDANITETVFDATDSQTGLRIRVECTAYRDYPVVEWVAMLSNTGQAPTPLVSNIRIMDTSLDGSSPSVVHCNGDYYSIDGYTPQVQALKPDESLSFAPNGGRSCDGAFPYYRVLFEGWGLSLAIGWPAQWAVEFSSSPKGLAIRAGQQKTHMKLLPGESIRTPRMTLLFWSGDGSRAVNLWRRWYLAHILPRPNGQPMQPHLACAATDEGEEFTAATEQNQKRFIDKFQQQGIHPDVWWIDAGWYPCYNKEHVRRWWITGTWKPDPERFPNGLKPVSEHAAKNGADLLVWFEPERIQPGTQLDLEHPDWLLRAPGNDNALLNLGIPECRQWLTDHICQQIQSNGIKIYRQDHNFPPLEHWRMNEAEDRQGMNENLHVQGYLQFWDDLLARNPGLWIDSCASGGRRNDLETMRRSVPLHYTDYGYGDHPIKLAFHHTLYQWIPYFKECTLSWDVKANERFDPAADSFSFHCGFAPMLFATLDIRRDDYDFGEARKMIAIWRKAADLLLHGDYYPHTPFQKRADQWVVWQFDNPEAGRGFIQGIRLQSSTDETCTVHLCAMLPDSTYLFTNDETAEHREVQGEALMKDGFTLKLSPRSGAVWLYRKID
ncbi:MAG TPA: alpha-galactosidase [Anaerolineae bacterium]